jgi:hypothetical protein
MGVLKLSSMEYKTQSGPYSGPVGSMMMDVVL